MREIREPPDLAAEWLSLPRDEEARRILQDHFAGRLRRLIQLRQNHLGDLNYEGLWLLDRSIFATYCDCVEAGGTSTAQGVLRSSSSPRGPGRGRNGQSRRPRGS